MPAEMSAAEWQTRTDLAALHRAIALYGWDDHIFTHISVRIPGEPQHMLLAPLGFMFAEVTASGLIKTTLDGEPVAATNGKLVNRGGVVIHGGIYQGAPHVNCVVHLHTPANVAVSAQRRGLLPISQYALVLTGKVAYHDYEGLAINFEERQRMISNLGEGRVMVLRNHGSLVCGTSVVDAHEYAYAYERACQIQVAALGARQEELVTCGEELGKLTASQFDYEPQMALLSWEAVLRRVRARAPGFDS